ncbi:TIGR03936 family radical SAM-associated protein [soil metagenome]
MRVRARYTKGGRLRFISAIDLGRLWERALRKAELPIAYSEGFTPHPKVSFPDALALGYASTGEYVELTFAVAVDIGAAVTAFNATAPEGLRIVEAIEVVDGAPRIARWLRASLWELRYSNQDTGVLNDGVRALAHAEHLPVDRERKGTSTRLDLKPALHMIASHEYAVRVILHHTEPPFRPTEVHQSLCTTGGLEALDEPRLVIRVAQGSPEPSGLCEALTGQLLHVAPHDHTTAAN